MASGLVSIHYREDVSDKKAAERALAGHAAKSYITWRVGSSESHFVLTYNSPTFNSTEHVDLRRLPDGSFKSSMGQDTGSYSTLGDFVATRQYIAPDAAVRTVQPDALSSGGSSSNAAPGGTDGLRKRAAGSSAVTSSVGGKADVPLDVPLPAARNVTLADDGDTIIAPTFSHPTLTGIFIACGVIGAMLAASTWAEYRTHEGIVKSEAALIASAVEGYVAEANTALWASLPAAAKGAGGGSGEAGIAAACDAAVQQWRATIAQAVPEAQAIFDAGEAPKYLRHLLALAFGGFFGCWLLTCVTTGRRIGAETPAYDPDAVESDANVANAAINGGGAREPACSAMQAKWILGFTVLLCGSGVAGLTAFHALWDYGGAGKAVEYAAKPLCTKYNWAVNGTTGAVAPWRLPPGEGIPISDGDANAPIRPPLGWFPGEFASALHAVKAPAACAAAVQRYVAPLVAMPPVLRVPLTSVLPPPLPWLIHAAAAARHAWLGRLSHWGLDVTGGREGGAHEDALTLTDDPMAGTRAFGWLDGGGEMLVLPSPAGVSFAVLEVAFGLLMLFLGTTLTVDWLAAAVPNWRQGWTRRAEQAVRTAREKSRQRAHAD